MLFRYWFYKQEKPKFKITIRLRKSVTGYLKELKNERTSKEIKYNFKLKSKHINNEYNE